MKKVFFESKRNVVLIAIFYTFLWGCAFPLVKICMNEFQINNDMSKCLLAGIRFFVAGIITLLWCLFSEKDGISIKKNQIKHIIYYGILVYFLQYAFTYMGLSKIHASKGAILDQLCVFIVILVSGFIFKDDKLSILKIIGCILGFAGITVCNTNGLNLEFSFGGEGMMLLATICQTAAYFIAKASSQKISAPKLVGYGQILGGGVAIVFALINGGSITTANTSAILSLIALSLISAVAYVLSLMPLKYFPASEISSFNLLITVFGVITSGIFLGENILKLNYLISIILISIGIIFINQKQRS